MHGSELTDAQIRACVHVPLNANGYAFPRTALPAKAWGELSGKQKQVHQRAMFRANERAERTEKPDSDARISKAKAIGALLREICGPCKGSGRQVLKHPASKACKCCQGRGWIN